MGARMEPVGAPTRKPGLLADADVIIDYRDSDLGILGLVNTWVGPLAVVTAIIEEVREITTEGLERLGIEVIEPSMAQNIRAEAIDSPVSFNDRLAFVVCSDEGRICVTNDLDLQRLCRDRGVPTRFGLRLLLDLVDAGALARSRAGEVARKIHGTNSRFINERVLRKFLDELAQRN